MKTFLKFALKPQWKIILIILILTMVQTSLQLSILDLFSLSLKYVKTKNIDGVMHNGSVMVIMTVILVLLLTATTILSNRVSTNAAYRTRQKIFHILTYLPLEEINNFKHTGLMVRTTRGVFSEQSFILFLLRDILPLPYITFGVIIELYLIRPIFALHFIIYFTVFLLLLFLFKMNKVVKVYFKAKKTFGTINQLVREKILGAKTVRIFQKQKFENEKFKKAGLNSYDKSIKYLLNQYYIAPLILLTFDMTIVILLAVMYKVSLKPNVADTFVINFVMGIQFVLYFISNLTFLQAFVEKWPKSYATSVRIEEVLKIEDKIYEKENKIKKSDFKGIEFKNVKFKQENHEIIKDVSFKIPSGSTVAIVGEASSGKTTLMYLLDKLLLLNEGEILIDGFDINDCASKDVRSRISFAMQKDFILNDTILNNIKMGDESITEDIVLDSCRKTGLDELLRNENLDLDSIIPENESNISGKFKNKLTLTRAIAHNRDIYIFDDYRYQMENKTNIILTQNACQITDVDHIIVLKSGKIVGEGNHEKLIRECSTYQKLYFRGEAC